MGEECHKGRHLGTTLGGSSAELSQSESGLVVSYSSGW